MAELTTQERLQPSLLDRLTDHDPGKKKESREQRVFSTRRLKDSVLRDLGWLLNTTNPLAPAEAEQYPEVARSVLNFGIPDLAGFTSTTINEKAFARLVSDAIVHFEPRIQRDSIHVDLRISDSEMSQNTLKIRIEGELWAVPVPLRLLVNSSIDLETGAAVITEQSVAG